MPQPEELAASLQTITHRVHPNGLLPSHWFTMAGCALLVVAVCAHRAMGPEFVRVIETDELITLQNYTWAGVNPDGSRRELRSVADILQLPRCTPRQFLIGCWCSVGRWTEPNNHIAHSLLVNVSLACCPNTLFAMRLPALVAAGLLALVLAGLCCQLNWTAAAPLAAALALLHPYVVEYSQQSRGYALVLLLAALMCLLLVRLARRPGSTLASLLMTASAIALCATMVNLIVDWVLPFYATAYVAAYAAPQGGSPPPAGAALRRQLNRQLVVVGSVVAAFVCDRLPYLYSSATQYGTPIASVAEGPAALAGLLAYLFPTLPLQLLLLVSASGMVLSCRQAYPRMVMAALLASLVLSAVHFVAALRLPYARGAGYLLLPVFLGAAAVTASAAHAARTARARGLSVASCYLLAIASLGWSQPAMIGDPAVREAAGIAAAQPPPIHEGDLLLLGYGVSEPLLLYLRGPPGGAGRERDLPQQVIVVEKTPFPLRFQNDPAPHGDTLFAHWPGTASAAIGMYRLSRVSAVPRPLDPDDLLTEPALVVWFPPLEEVATSPQRVLSALRRSGIPFYEVNERYQAKMDIFSRLKCVVMPVRPGEPSDAGGGWPGQFAALRQRFGGRAIVLRPPPVRSDSHDIAGSDWYLEQQPDHPAAGSGGR
jgi:hypothetical protein